MNGVNECVQHPLTPNHNPDTGGVAVMAVLYSTRSAHEGLSARSIVAFWCNVEKTDSCLLEGEFKCSPDAEGKP